MYMINYDYMDIGYSSELKIYITPSVNIFSISSTCSSVNRSEHSSTIYKYHATNEQVERLHNELAVNSTEHIDYRK